MEMIYKLKYLPQPLNMIVQFLGSPCGPCIDVLRLRLVNKHLNQEIRKIPKCMFVQRAVDVDTVEGRN